MKSYLLLIFLLFFHLFVRWLLLYARLCLCTFIRFWYGNILFFSLALYPRFLRNIYFLFAIAHRWPNERVCVYVCPVSVYAYSLLWTANSRRIIIFFYCSVWCVWAFFVFFFVHFHLLLFISFFFFAARASFWFGTLMLCHNDSCFTTCLSHNIFFRLCFEHFSFVWLFLILFFFCSLVVVSYCLFRALAILAFVSIDRAPCVYDVYKWWIPHSVFIHRWLFRLLFLFCSFWVF